MPWRGCSSTWFLSRRWAPVRVSPAQCAGVTPDGSFRGLQLGYKQKSSVGGAPVPESKVRKEAAAKKSYKRAGKAQQAQKSNIANRLSATRDWVPYVFVPLLILGALWLVVFYIAGSTIGFMVTLGNWNFLVGIGLIATGFGFATLWK